jgi:hypothetical protein
LAGRQQPGATASQQQQQQQQQQGKRPQQSSGGVKAAPAAGVKRKPADGSNAGQGEPSQQPPPAKKRSAADGDDGDAARRKQQAQQQQRRPGEAGGAKGAGAGAAHITYKAHHMLGKQGSTSAAAAAAALADAQQGLGQQDSLGPFARHQHAPQDRQRRLGGSEQAPAGSGQGAAAVQGSALVLAGLGQPGDNQGVLEVFVEPPDGGAWALARLERSKLTSFVDLWRQLQGELPGLMRGQHTARLKVVYLDTGGDWVLALREQRWQSFLPAARRVLVTSLC